MSGNNLECRNYHAGAAAGSQANADLHCPHAGPAGDGACGTNCQGFCGIVQAVCTGANQQYTTPTVCETACATFGNVGGRYTNTSTQSGNNYQCRVYHVSVAANPGNSGGPALDAAARVCGVVTAGSKARDGSVQQGITFCIPAADVRKALDKLKK